MPNARVFKSFGIFYPEKGKNAIKLLICLFSNLLQTCFNYLTENQCYNVIIWK